jgi:hypothetical protein
MAVARSFDSVPPQSLLREFVKRFISFYEECENLTEAGYLRLRRLKTFVGEESASDGEDDAKGERVSADLATALAQYDASRANDSGHVLEDNLIEDGYEAITKMFTDFRNTHTRTRDGPRVAYQWLRFTMRLWNVIEHHNYSCTLKSLKITEKIIFTSYCALCLLEFDANQWDHTVAMFTSPLPSGIVPTVESPLP